MFCPFRSMGEESKPDRNRWYYFGIGWSCTVWPSGVVGPGDEWSERYNVKPSRVSDRTGTSDEWNPSCHLRFRPTSGPPRKSLCTPSTQEWVRLVGLSRLRRVGREWLRTTRQYTKSFWTLFSTLLHKKKVKSSISILGWRVLNGPKLVKPTSTVSSYETYLV